MPDLFEIMETCRSMRRLKPDPVPDELISRILQAGTCAPNGGNFQRWRFLVIKDRKIKQAVQALYKRAFDETVGPRYLASEPPPGVSKERYLRQHAAVAYLTDHFHEAPVWIVACQEDGANPGRAVGASVYPAVQNMILAARALGLDAGPMSGFDNAKVDEAFFAGTPIRSNVLVNLGVGDPASIFPRSPRLGFDEACRID